MIRHDFWSEGSVTLMVGDARDRMCELADESIQCVVTSPPYWGLRDYGAPGQIGLEASPELYVHELVAVFNQVYRVLRKDGALWVNLGDSYAAHPGQRKATDKAGTKQQSKRGSTSIGSHHVDGLKAKDLIGMPWRVAFALQRDGWYLRSDIIWHKSNSMPESVTDRPTKAHEYLFLLTKSERYYYDAETVKELGMGAARNRRTVWTIPTQPYPEAHFATFPEALVEPCILAGSREGDTVLDPFVGSGTTLAVARRLGRKAIGIELQPFFLSLIQKRVRESAMPLLEAIG